MEVTDWNVGRSVLWRVLVQTALVIVAGTRRERDFAILDLEKRLQSGEWRVRLAAQWVAFDSDGFEHENVVAKHTISEWNDHFHRWEPRFSSQDPVEILGVWCALAGIERAPLAEKIAERARQIHDEHERGLHREIVTPARLVEP